MMETTWLYLILNGFTISVPLLRSFDNRVSYYKRWKALFSAIFLTGVFFIVWDVLFTKNGVWGFNPLYLSGIYWFELPLGEWLFFLTVPFSCIFIYDVLNYFWPETPKIDKASRIVNLVLAAILGILAFVNFEKAYTFWNFLYTSAFLLFLQFSKPLWLGKLYRAYAVGLLGFFMVNGVLTGTGIAEEVVWYNSEEFMGIRMITIPVEDTFYGFLLIAMNTWWYEKLKPVFSTNKQN